MTGLSHVRKPLLSLGCVMALPALLLSQTDTLKRHAAPSLKRGEKQLFVDDLTIRMKRGTARVVHPATKLERPVLEAEMPWEVRDKEGILDKRVNIYGTVLRDDHTGAFRMWYADPGSVLYATSNDGIRWVRPVLKF